VLASIARVSVVELHPSGRCVLAASLPVGNRQQGQDRNAVSRIYRGISVA